MNATLCFAVHKRYRTEKREVDEKKKSFRKFISSLLFSTIYNNMTNASSHLSKVYWTPTATLQLLQPFSISLNSLKGYILIELWEVFSQKSNINLYQIYDKSTWQNFKTPVKYFLQIFLRCRRALRFMINLFLSFSQTDRFRK